MIKKRNPSNAQKYVIIKVDMHACIMNIFLHWSRFHRFLTMHNMHGPRIFSLGGPRDI